VLVLVLLMHDVGLKAAANGAAEQSKLKASLRCACIVVDRELSCEQKRTAISRARRREIFDRCSHRHTPPRTSAKNLKNPFFSDRE
jgi:hypothetical protein